MQLFLLGKLNENSKVIRNYANRLFICIMVLETSREKRRLIISIRKKINSQYGFVNKLVFSRQWSTILPRLKYLRPVYSVYLDFWKK